MILDRLDRRVGRDNYQFLAGIGGIGGLVGWGEDEDADSDEEVNEVETAAESSDPWSEWSARGVSPRIKAGLRGRAMTVDQRSLWSPCVTVGCVLTLWDSDGKVSASSRPASSAPGGRAAQC